MNDVLVSVRMTKSLLLRLKELAKKNHYMDVSEEVRSVVRKRWLEFTQPELLEIKNLRKDIFEQIKKQSSDEITKKVIQELNEIKKYVKKED